MKDATIQRLYNELVDANGEVDRLERAIGNLQRACKHVRTVGDINWCEECGGLVPVHYESTGGSGG